MTTDPTQCGRCGKPHAACAGHRRDGDPCHTPPMRGQGVCRMHGGAKSAARANAERRLAATAAEADARRLLAHEGHQGVSDPVEVIARLATEADAMRAALASRVNALRDLRFEDAKGSEQLRSEVALYERALDRTARFCEVLARLGYAEREQERLDRLARQEAELLAAAVHRILGALDLSEVQRQVAPGVVARELRAVAEIEEAG